LDYHVHCVEENAEFVQMLEVGLERETGEVQVEESVYVAEARLAFEDGLVEVGLPGTVLEGL